MTEQEVIHAAENGGGEDVAIEYFNRSKEIGVSFRGGEIGVSFYKDGRRHAFRRRLDHPDLAGEITRYIRDWSPKTEAA